MFLETLNKIHFNAKTKKNPYSCNISKEGQNYKPYKGQSMLKYTKKVILLGKKHKFVTNRLESR
jgi:hypothetical protein